LLNNYSVYSHWLDGKCIYVGSGNKDRPFNFKRNKKYNELTKDRKSDIIVKVYYNDLSKKDSLIKENRIAEELMKKYDLALYRNGTKWNEKGKKKFQKENNGMYGKLQSEESKKKISEAMSGEKHPMYGKGYKVKGEKNGMFGLKGKDSPNYGAKSGAAVKISVINNENGEIIKTFGYIGEAAEFYKSSFCRATISRSVKGEDPKILRKIGIHFKKCSD